MPMGSYLEWFRSCSPDHGHAHPAVAVPGGVHRRTGCRSGCSSSAASAASRRCCGSRGRSPTRPGSRRAAGALMPWPATPPTAAHRAAYADAEPRSFWLRRAARAAAPALHGVHRAPTCASSAAASPGCGRRCTPRRDDPARDVVLLEAETAGLRRQRAQRRVRRGLADARDRERARALRRRDAGARAARRWRTSTGLQRRPRRATASTATSRPPASCSR